MSKKTSTIVIISVLVILLSLIISICIPNFKKIEEKIEDNSITYYLLKRDENFGVIDGSGSIVINPQYEQIIIPNPHRAVFLCKDGDKTKVLNDKNEEIFEKYSDIEAIRIENIISESMYEKKVLIYKENDKYGLLGIDGQVVAEPKYDEISSLGYKEGEILVKENDKYGIVNSQGNQVIKTIYDSIESDTYYSQEEGYEKSGYIVCVKTHEGYRYGYYDWEGNEVLKEDYNQITRLAEVKNKENIYLIAAKNGQYGVFINNNKMINTQYQSITYTPEMDMFIVERTGQYGVMNELGIEILKTEYSNIEINGIYIYAKNGEEEKVFDKTGAEVNIPFNTIIESTTNPDYFIKIEQGENVTYSLLGSNLQEILNQKYNYIEYIYDKYFIATNETGKSGIIDAEGKIILEFKYDSIQLLKTKQMIQATNFETNTTEIYNNEMQKTIEMANINVQVLDEYVKIYNETMEYYVDNNGNIIRSKEMLERIKETNATLRIENFKRVTYGLEQYYYVEEN